MKWAVLVAALVALLIVETLSLPTPKDKKVKKEKHINEEDKTEKDVDSGDNAEKDEDVKDADETDEDVKEADKKVENVKDAHEKDEDVKEADEKDEDVKDADENDEDGNEKKSKTTVRTAKKKKATTKNTKVKDETDKKKKIEKRSEDDTHKVDLDNTKTKKETDKKKNTKKVKTEVALDIKETKKTMTKDDKTEETEENVVDEKQVKINKNTVEGISEEEVDMYDDYAMDDLGAEAVKGNEKNLIEDMNEDLYLPISGRLKSVMLPESDRVMDEPDFLPRAEAVMDDPFEGSEKQRAEERQSLEPTAERVMMAQEAGKKPGGDGKMKMHLNLKDLDGNPSDLTVGAAAVGLMSQAVKSKGPDDNQVNAVAGFGHQIMGLVSELEKDSK